MSDSGYREIQLSGKHVVFLFMAGVVAAVAIFLLGVSVGRGATKPDAAAALTPVPVDPASPPAASPASTTPAPDELQFHKALQGSPTPSPAASLKPTSTPTPSAKPSPKPDGAAPPKSAGIYVLVNSFASRANADRQIADLKDKNITAKLNVRAGTGARYQVRVGPLDDAAAKAMVDRLRKEGFKPSVIR